MLGFTNSFTVTPYVSEKLSHVKITSTSIFFCVQLTEDLKFKIWQIPCLDWMLGKTFVSE